MDIYRSNAVANTASMKCRDRAAQTFPMTIMSEVNAAKIGNVFYSAKFLRPCVMDGPSESDFPHGFSPLQGKPAKSD